MHPSRSAAVAAAAMNMTHITPTQVKLSPTKGKSYSCHLPSSTSESADGLTASEQEAGISPEAMKKVIPTTSLTIPRLPGHIPALW